jgi:hypothetical protein
MWVGGERRTIEYCASGTGFYVKDGTQIVGGPYRDYLSAEQETKSEFLYNWATKFVSQLEGQDVIAHNDDEPVEVILAYEDDEPVEDAWVVVTFSNQHRAYSRYYIVWQDEDKFIPQTLEASALNECRTCEREWNDAHPERPI